MYTKKIGSRIIGGLVIIGMLAMIAACGSNTQPAGTDASNTPAAAQTAATTEPSPTSEPDAAKQEEAASTTRTFTDAVDREVEIPVKPERVVALWSVGDMLLLGQKPVGSTTNLLRFFDEADKEGIADVGDNDHFEAILALNPDLILVSARLSAEDIDAYQKIAPTIATPFYGEAFATFSMVADALGKQEEEQAYLAVYAEKTEQARKAISEIVEPGETAIVLQMAQKTIYIYPTSIFPTIYRELGFSLQEKQAALEVEGKFAPVQLAEEALLEYDADRVFVIINDEDSKDSFAQIKEGAVWRNLESVKQGKVYMVHQRLSLADAKTLDWAIEEIPQLLQQQ